VAGPFDVFLLAGGRSSRMGRDKAALTIGRRTFVEAVADAARPLAAAIRVVGRDAATSGIPAVADLRPGLGPLAGIETALAHARTQAALVLACDLPFVSTALLELLAGESAAAPDSIVVPEDAAGWRAPLCAIYPVSALGAASRLLDAGERRPRALLEAVPSLVVPFDAYRHLPGAPLLLRNVNTPEDYEGIREASSDTDH
jgi:molybdopterin-guanine dinucleotide biosynthesis protein A